MSDESFKLCVHGLKITFYSYNNKANAMATPQYSDLFTYEYISVFNIISKYTNVTLLKKFDEFEAGTAFDYAHLNLANGKFEFFVHKKNIVTRSETAAAKTLVEFKGKHTRFPDTDDKTKVLDKGTPLDKGESSKTGVVTLKLYEHKRKLFKPDSSIKEYVIKYILSHVNGTLVEETTGPRGELLVTLRPSNEIPKNVLLPFTVCTARNRSRTCYYKTA